MHAPTRILIGVFALLSGLVALSASAARPTFRADPDYLIDTLDTEDGWPASAPTAMAQTPDGYLWLGTLDGLVRFDGLKFDLFGQSSLRKLPNEAVVKLHLDRTGNLWVGTANGIAVRSGRDWRAAALPGTNNNRGNQIVCTLAERPGGDLLVTTLDGGVLEFRAGQFHPLPAPPGATNTPYSGCVDEAGNWWVAQHKFIGKWDGQRWVETVSLADISNLAAGQVRCATGRAGGLWLLVGPELRHYRGGVEAQRTPLPGFGGRVMDLLEDSRGNVWIGTWRAGLWQVNSKGLVRHWTRSNGLADNAVPFVFEDRDWNIWVGMEQGGLTRLKQRTFQSFLTVTDRLAFTRFAVAASPTGGVFIASYLDGLRRADAEGIAKVPLPAPFTDSSVSALCLLVDRSGCLWTGAMTNGVWRIEGQDAQWMPIDDSGRAPVYALFEDSRGRIWLAGGQSVSVFEAGTMLGVGAARGLPAGLVQAFGEDKAGTIWLAHSRGVFRLETNHWVEVLDAKGGSLGMNSLLADADGTLWMGSVQHGLACWRDGHLLQKKLPPALPMRGAYTFLEDNLGFFWMTSPAGVLRARKSDLKAWLEGKQPAVTWQIFNASDGLPAAECGTSARDGQGRLWFATSRGVARVDAAVDHPNPIPPPVQIEELTYHRAAAHVYGGEAEGALAPIVQSRLQWPFPERLILPPGSRRLQVHYTALDFTAPEKLRFQTRLDPNDTDWQDVGDRRVAYYYDFTPGSYVFRVRAVNHDGVWNEADASLAFTVLPFYWQTSWFRALVGLLLVASGGGAVFWRSRAKRRLELAEMEHLRRESADRKRADERFRLAVEASPNGIVLVDSEGRIILVNAKTERLFGYSREELIGHEIEMLVPERFRGAHPGLLSGFFAASQTRAMGAGGELFARRKDGTDFPVEITLSPIQAEQGALVLCALVDLTGPKRAEQELAQQRNEVAHLSRVTTLGEISGSLAHELNQPLCAMMVNTDSAELHLQSPTPKLDEVRAILADIRKDGQRAGEIIHGMRAFLRRKELEMQPLEVGQLARDAVKLISADAVARKTTVGFEIPPDLPRVTGDRVHLQQVLLNLLVNGMDAMSNCPVADRRITIRATRPDPHTVEIAVSDAGVGIPPGDLDRVFTPFHTTKHGGLGLGLPICRSIVEAHGGSISLKNNPDRGATVRISLPASVGGRA